MKTKLPDGRVFETMPILNIKFNSQEPVYKFEFSTTDRQIKSSSRHLWAVWDKHTHTLDMVRMDTIDVEKHELLIQGWDTHDCDVQEI